MSADQRDQWGETAEERHARILARDLAWMTYAEACARDGVPRSERDHLIFNDGYAAGRADYLPAEGVAAEEPEWEYGIHSEISGNVNSVGAPWMDREFAEKVTANDSGNYGVRRRKAGPWVPVKQEGAGDA